MVNLLYLFPIITFWHSVASEITKYTSADMANNSISFIHCLLYLIHYHYGYNLDDMLHVTIGYYMYDLFYLYRLITNRVYPLSSSSSWSSSSSSIGENVLHGSLILHHLAGIYLITETFTSDYKLIILSGYNLMEQSNIMLYVSNYLHNEYINRHIIIVSDLIYFVWYAYFRVICLSYVIYQNLDAFFELSIMSRSFIILLYCMGFAWSCKLLKQNLANIR